MYPKQQEKEQTFNLTHAPYQPSAGQELLQSTLFGPVHTGKVSTHVRSVSSMCVQLLTSQRNMSITL